ncbi:MAG: hypothetical protein IPH44_11950 [Myxococcales bacterium]|nr:hypothetical protein [Myxococcales bacterium]
MTIAATTMAAAATRHRPRGDARRDAAVSRSASASTSASTSARRRGDGAGRLASAARIARPSATIAAHRAHPSA